MHEEIKEIQYVKGQERTAATVNFVAKPVNVKRFMNEDNYTMLWTILYRIETFWIKRK